MKADPARTTTLWRLPSVAFAPVALFVAAGCVSAPPARAPQPGLLLPERFVAAESAPVAAVDPPGAPWWTTFGDASLDAVVAEALVGNRDLAVAAARVDQAAAAARAAGAALSPQLSAAFDANRARRNFIGFPIPGSDGGGVLSTTSGTLGLSLNASWEPDLWGRLRSGQLAALADRAAQQAMFDAARLSLAGQTARLWLTAVEAQQQVALARRTLESRRQGAARVATRYEQGLRPPIDLRLAQNAEAAAAATLAARERLLDVTIRQLEVIAGRYPSGQLVPAAGLPALPPPVPAGLPADLIGRRPDLLAAEMALVAAGARVSEARASLLPQIRLTASGGTATNQLQDLLNGDFTVWSLVAGLTQPLFQAGRIRAGIDAVEAAREAAVASYAQAALVAFSEVELSLAADGYLALQEAALDRSRREAAEARRLAEDRYFAGLADYLDVLDAQRQELQAESQWLEVRRVRLTTRVDLHIALGGGFDPPADPIETATVVGADQEAQP